MIIPRRPATSRRHRLARRPRLGSARRPQALPADLSFPHNDLQQTGLESARIRLAVMRAGGGL